MIRIEHLDKRFGALKVLQDINVEFVRGKTYGIVGKNGAGKTTFFRCIAGLETFDGRLEVENTFKSKLGYLPTEPTFLPRITGAEYIRLFCQSRNAVMPDLSEANFFNLPLDNYISAYSTGMKKKVVITAVILQRNDYFIFDEPFNGLDLESSILFSEIIKKLQRSNKTILISSHIFSTLKDVCEEILVLDNGRLSDSISKDGFDALEKSLKEELVQIDLSRFV